MSEENSGFPPHSIPKLQRLQERKRKTGKTTSHVNYHVSCAGARRAGGSGSRMESTSQPRGWRRSSSTQSWSRIHMLIPIVDCRGFQRSI